MKPAPLTLLLAIVVLLVSIFDPLTDWLLLDFALVSDGQWWRIWTGHLTHYDGNHLFWDLLMFVTLGWICEQEHPKMFGVTCLAMAAWISLVIAVTCPDVTHYRGLSGIDTGLFVWFVIDQLRHSWSQRQTIAVCLWSLPLAALGVKLVYESVTGDTLFVDSEGFRPLVESHLAGAVLGGALASLPRSIRDLEFPIFSNRKVHQVGAPGCEKNC